MSAVLVVSALLAAVVQLWLAFLKLAYPMTDEPVRQLRATASDGWSLSVWHRPATKRRFREAVVLCHGVANNHFFWELLPEHSLAAHLAAQGFECYSVDLRGAGASPGPWPGPNDVSFDDHVRLDCPAIVAFVQAHADAPRVFWVGHSLGGLIALAASTGPLGRSFAALVTIASPLYFRFRPTLAAVLSWARRLAVWGQFPTGGVALFAPLAGRCTVPRIAHLSANLDNMSQRAQAHAVVNVFAPMWRGVLAQFEDWVKHDVFRSSDGATDYRGALKDLKVPVLMVGGTVDAIAPPDVTRDSFEALGSDDKQLAMFGTRFGHSADYGHGDLVLGAQSPRDVFPVVSAFLEARATALTEA